MMKRRKKGSKLRYYLIIVLYITICTYTLYAQNSTRVDSLKVLINSGSGNKFRFEKLIELSGELISYEPSNALTYARDALSVANELGNEDYQLIALINISKIYQKNYELSLAMESAVKSRSLAEKLDNEKALAESIRIIGLVYSDLGNYNKSSECLFECLRIFEEINDSVGISKALNQIGILFSNSNDNNKALEYYFRYLNISKKMKYNKGVASALNNIATSFMDNHEYEKAKTYIDEALQINKINGFKEWEGVNLMNLGIISLALEKHEDALNYFKQAESIFGQLNNQYLKTQCLINLGDYYRLSNNYKKALEYTKNAYELSSLHGFQNLVQIASGNLFNSYLNQNDTANAFKYSLIYYQTKDTLNKEKSRRGLSMLELQYNFEKEEQAKLNEKKQRDLINIILILNLLIGLILVVFMLFKQRLKMKIIKVEKEKLNDDLVKKNKELTTNVIYLIRKNIRLVTISEQLERLKYNPMRREDKEKIRTMVSELKKCSEPKIWKEFELRFNDVQSEFYDKLANRYPDLTANDLRICAFLKLNMSSKEISQLTGQQISTIEHTRSRIRRKLGISNTRKDLITFMSQI